MVGSLNIYETHDCDLAAFLMLEGLKYVEAIIDPMSNVEAGKPRIILRFLDPKGTARDLERVYMNSEYYKYRVLHKYTLKEVHRAIHGINGKYR